MCFLGIKNYKSGLSWAPARIWFILKIPTVCSKNGPGTDGMILKIFSPKKLAKIFAFFAQTTVSFCKNCDHNIGL
jgi:hypothetical protein